MSKDIVDWAKDLKHNEKTAIKYKGVQTVEEILKLARQDGYNFSKSELLDFDLDAVAGGKKDNGFYGVGANINTGLFHDNNIDIGDISGSIFGDIKKVTANLQQQAQVANTGANSYTNYGHHGTQSVNV